MKCKTWVFLIMCLFALAGCSLGQDGGGKANGAGEESGETEAVFEGASDSSSPVFSDNAEVTPGAERPLAVDNASGVMSGEQPNQPSAIAAIDNGGEVQVYNVEKGDTYMFVAFKLYGDYRLWKKISKLNGGKKMLSAGDKLKYYPLKEPFEWTPTGDPYLIQRGDTLGLISKGLYGTPSKWKALWENNRTMIHNPNLIFAGFTLYYVK